MRLALQNCKIFSNCPFLDTSDTLLHPMEIAAKVRHKPLVSVHNHLLFHLKMITSPTMFTLNLFTLNQVPRFFLPKRTMP